MPVDLIATGITSIVSLLSSYMTYRVGMKKAASGDAEAPPEPEAAALEQAPAALELVQTAVARAGDDDDRADLESFSRNPERYREALARALHAIVERDAVLAQRVQDYATSGERSAVHGTVDVSGGNVDQAVGVNTGTMVHKSK